MQRDFLATAKNVAGQMGCNTQCLENCVRTHQQPQCFEKCQCGNGVIKITPQKVNTFSIIKETYGDLNALSQDDIETIDENINQF
jgi:hypothetical protein